MKESNILLAIFLGLEFEEGQDRLFIQGLGTQLIEDTFNKKWDWLMQVVEKIEDNEFTIAIDSTDCAIYGFGDFKDLSIKSYNKPTKIEAVYNACVEFVEWWNKNK